jgi:hypothetical protein
VRDLREACAACLQGVPHRQHTAGALRESSLHEGSPSRSAESTFTSFLTCDRLCISAAGFAHACRARLTVCTACLHCLSISVACSRMRRVHG